MTGCVSSVNTEAMPFSEDQFRAILSGRRTDATAALLRPLLGAASLGYGLAAAVRNASYDRGLLRVRHVDVPVLSIGNITTGGTGKTPLVVWLCRQLTERTKLGTQNAGVAVLTRGYKGKRESGVRSQESGDRDEVALLAGACPGVQVVVNPDRVAGAKLAIDRGARVLVLDDGLQHRRLARDLDIVAIDATLPFGYGRLLPAGLLREPLAALARAQAAVVTRSDLAPPDRLAQIERVLRKINPGLVIARAVHAPTAVHLADRRTLGPADLAGRRAYAFCGIGNPEAFFRTLTRLGVDLAGTKAFDDHHACTRGEIERICQEAKATGADLILSTEKNWMSLGPAWFDGRTPAGYLEIRLELTAGREDLLGLIRAALDRSRAHGSNTTPAAGGPDKGDREAQCTNTC